MQNYSSAADDIQRALLAVIRQDRGNGPGAGSSGGGSGPSAGGSSSGGSSSGGSSTGGSSPPTSGVLGSFSPSSAQSIPLPLLVLGGLALLLLLAAGATLVARRIQARRGPAGPTGRPAIDKRS